MEGVLRYKTTLTVAGGLPDGGEDFMEAWASPPPKRVGLLAHEELVPEGGVPRDVLAA